MDANSGGDVTRGNELTAITTLNDICPNSCVNFKDCPSSSIVAEDYQNVRGVLTSGRLGFLAGELQWVCVF